VLQHPDDQVGLLLHQVQVLGGTCLEILNWKIKCIVFNLWISARLSPHGHNGLGSLTGVENDSPVLLLLLDHVIHVLVNQVSVLVVAIGLLDPQPH
jgi:hypothetical protein